MTNSRSKGARGERQLAAVLTTAGFPATRGQQHRGGPGSPDVLCPSLPGLHWECKHTERFNLYDALEQAARDADGGWSGRNLVPVVAHRRNDCEWVAVLRLEDFLSILRESSLVVQTVGAAAALMGGFVEGVETCD